MQYKPHDYQKFAVDFIETHPQGKYVTATVVDHIVPHRGDHYLMWSDTNWQALCKPCHDKKTGTEDSRPEYIY